MKNLFTFLAAFLVAVPVFAQAPFIGYAGLRYDLDAASITYCKTSELRPVDYLVDNASSSTAVTSATAGQAVFQSMEAGDVIFITVGGVVYPRGILTVTDTENIVVDEAIDLSASDYRISWMENDCGTAATSGWIDVPPGDVTVGIFLKQFQGDDNGLDVRIEGGVQAPDGTTHAVQAWPSGKNVAATATVQNFKTGGVDPTAGITSNIFVHITAPIEQIRVGMLHNTADEGNDLTTNAEQITVAIYAGRMNP